MGINYSKLQRIPAMTIIRKKTPEFPESSLQILVVAAGGVEAGSPAGKCSLILSLLIDLRNGWFNCSKLGLFFGSSTQTPALFITKEVPFGTPFISLVEAGGVEPPSETISTRFSTGVVCCLLPCSAAPADGLTGQGRYISPVTPS